MKRIREKYYPEYELFERPTPRDTKDTNLDVTNGVLRNIYRMFSLRKLSNDPVKIENGARKGQFVDQDGAQNGQIEGPISSCITSRLRNLKIVPSEGPDGAQSCHLEGQNDQVGGQNGQVDDHDGRGSDREYIGSDVSLKKCRPRSETLRQDAIMGLPCYQDDDNLGHSDFEDEIGQAKGIVASAVGESTLTLRRGET